MKTRLWSALFVLLGLTAFSELTIAQVAPSHDPSRIIRNTDGRYWVFTTGDGVWAMSSPNADMSNWRAENTVFPVGSWPSWINNYVTGFGGFFWAPDVIYLNGQYWLYYSCAGQGAPAAIGVATASNLAGPWTDRGLVVAGNNAIDPAPLMDGGNLWLTWGNWQTGIDLLQLNTSSGKPLNSSRWDLVPGQVEGPYLLKNGSYYYLFFQKGLCCNGVNSTYYTVVGRSTSVTGPYIDRAGVSVVNGGGTVFLPNRDGRYIGPGHVGFGEGRLTYHFYDGNDNGAPKLRVTTLSFVDGWPVAAGVNVPSPGGSIANGTYRLRNRASGRYLDNLGSTADGASVSQWDGGTSNNQRWVVTTSGGYTRLRNVAVGKYLDNINNTADGSAVAQWADSPNFNQQWTISATGSYYKVINRTNGKALDTGGQTANGTFMQFWTSGSSNNQQWTFEQISTSTSVASQAVVNEAATTSSADVLAAPLVTNAVGIQLNSRANHIAFSLPTSAAGEKRVTVLTQSGLVLAEGAFSGAKYSLNIADVPAGKYVLRVIGDYGVIEERAILIKR